MTTTAVVGTQYGDEGKGKIIDFLSQFYDITARYNGGNNAGHTVISDGKKIVLHMIPSGILHKKSCVIGNGAVINLEALLKEAQEVENALDINIRDYLYMSELAHVILPGDIRKSKGDASSTNRGIKEAYERKYGRQGVRLYDLLNLEHIAKEDPRFKTFLDNGVGIRKLSKIAESFRNQIGNVSTTSKLSASK